MINYSEKGTGMHNAIRDAGFALRQENGEWTSADHDGKNANDEAVQKIIDGYSLEEAATSICTQIDEYAGRLRNKVTKGVSPAEMSSWPLKVSEAQAVKAGGSPNDAKLLMTEASLRGVTVDSIADRVLTNFQRLGEFEATVAGVAGKHKDGVRAQLSFEEIQAYDWKTDWPVI